MADVDELWAFLPWGYLFTISIETPILIVGLSRAHRFRRKLCAGLWLTACTYPVVVLTLPLLMPPHTTVGTYLAVAETFAPLAECLLFRSLYHRSSSLGGRQRLRDLAAIVTANLTSFVLGELAHRVGLFEWMAHLRL
jgi:hypothetical protein